ncbi:MAG: formate--tetrahydrofolate ligase [Candidatus Nanopelagicales bacterium]
MNSATPQPSDLEIAQSATLRPIADVAADLQLGPDDWEPYGRDVAKLELSVLDREPDGPPARYVLVTAVTPTPLGEGKTTTAVGLVQALGLRGRRPVLTLRQPSQGPTFGIKGGAAGGGWSQVVPMERMNLHLTGDMHAVTAAHNLLAAVVDNHLHQGNRLGLDLREITWRRVLDINDRALRNIVIGLGERVDGVPRQTGFDITAASEVMTVLALARSLQDLRVRLGRIVVGFTAGGEPISADDLGVAGAMAVLLKDALRPNLMQTLEGQPVLVHAGPFGNIATGNSSVIADLIASTRADYVVTEAGFGSDMGAERFFDVKCRASGLAPDAAVVVTTIRSMKSQSGRHRIVPGKPLPAEMLDDRPDEVRAGAANLAAHIDILRRFGVQPVVAINVFPTDHPGEVAEVVRLCAEMDVVAAPSTHVRDGGKGALALADAVEQACEQPSTFVPLYGVGTPSRDALSRIATEVYGADGIDLAPAAERQMDRYQRLGWGDLPVCVAKTHLSLSHDPALKGAPRGWRLPVREVKACTGAGYLYAVCGEMRLMPGLPSHPAAERIDLADDGSVVGLF